MIPFTSFDLNNIKNLLDSKTINDEVEFKIRIPSFNNKSLKYDSNISQNYFNNLKSFLNSETPLYFEKSIIQSYDNYRSINIEKTTQKNAKPGIIYNYKQRIDLIDFNFYFLELRLTKSIDKTISKEEFNSKSNEKPFIRNRNRYVYKLNDYMELHLSAIMAVNKISYECEFEINKGISIDDLVKTLNKYLHIITNIDELPRNEEVLNLQKQYNKLINDDKHHRNELIDIKLSDVKNMIHESVSNKLDGIQYYLFIFNNTIYLFNPLRISQTNSNSLKVYRVKQINSDLNNTILAGEYLQNKNYPSQGVADYNIFDTLFYKNKNVENLKFTERLHYVPLIINELKNVKIDNLNLLAKPFFWKDNLYSSTLRTILYMYDKYKDKTIEENDGIIFIPTNDPYINNKSKKWKFWQRRSIDVGLITTSNKNVFKMYTGFNDPFSIKDQNTVYVNESFPDFNQLKNGSVLEIRYINGEIVPDKLRNDKPFPNNTRVANAVKEDMLNIIYLTDLLTEMKKYFSLSESSIDEKRALEIARKWDGKKEVLKINTEILKIENFRNLYPDNDIEICINLPKMNGISNTIFSNLLIYMTKFRWYEKENYIQLSENISYADGNKNYRSINISYIVNPTKVSNVISDNKKLLFEKQKDKNYKSEQIYQIKNTKLLTVDYNNVILNIVSYNTNLINKDKYDNSIKKLNKTTEHRVLREIFKIPDGFELHFISTNDNDRIQLKIPSKSKITIDQLQNNIDKIIENMFIPSQIEEKEEKVKTPQQQDCFTQMRKYHNKLKRQLISSTIGETKKKIVDVIDIGGGKLGDLDKYWETNKINRIYVIEPNKEYVDAGNKRIDTLINDKKIKLNPKAKTNTFIINQPLQNIKPIYEQLKNKVDFISSFFSLTFLFDSEKDVDLLVNFLFDKLNDGGHFIGTTMDGIKTRTLLDEEKGKINIGNCGSITRLYDPLKPINYGDKIELKLGTATVDKQIESLVYFDILTNKLQEKRIKLIQSNFFRPKDLNKDETLLSSLNRFFIFKKESPPTRELKMLSEHEILAFDNDIDPNIQLVRIGTLGEDHCFYHSYMYSTSEKYRNASHEQKRKMTAIKRKEISSKITLDDYKNEGNGQTLIVEFLDKAKKDLNINSVKFDKLNKLISPSADEFLTKFEKEMIKEDYKEIKDYIDKTLKELLQNFKKLIGHCQITHAAIPFLMKKLEINIIMIRDSTRKLYDNLLTEKFNDNNLYIVMLNLGNYHYEAVGILYADKNNNAIIDHLLLPTEELPMIVKNKLN